MIPKLASFYWGNERMSYLRYLTLASFRKQNPKWDMILYRRTSLIGETWREGGQMEKFTYDGPDYSDRIADLGVMVCDTADASGMSDIHISDTFTYAILASNGGLVSDMDILFIRPMETILRDDMSAGLVRFHTHASNGEPREGYMPVSFLLACEKSPFFDRCSNEAKSAYDPTVYESCGTPVLDKVNREWPWESPPLLPDECVFPFQRHADWSFSNIVSAIHESNFSAEVKGSPKTVGLHWYAGTPAGQAHNHIVTEESMRNHRDTLCTLAKEMGF